MSEVLRPYYYQGQFLGAKDFDAEQRFHRDQQRRHVIGHHTWGIVVGLELEERTKDTDIFEIYVLPGMAIDGYGRELVVWRPTLVDIAKLVGLDPGNVSVWLSYSEEATGRSDILCGDVDVYGRTRQLAELIVEPDDPDSHSIGVDGNDIKPPTVANIDEIVAPYDESVPYQELPDGLRWYVRLGSISWNGSQIVTTSPENRAKDRRYSGSIAQHLLSPDGTLRIASRLAPRDAPPPDAEDAEEHSYAELCAVLEGYLEVVKRLTVAQIGVAMTDKCDDSSVANLHVAGGATIPAGGDGPAYAVVGPNDKVHLMLDNEGVQVFDEDGTTPALLKFQSQGGDLAVQDDKLFVMDGGNVGVGTAAPKHALHIKGDNPVLALDIDGASGNEGPQLSLRVDDDQRSRLYFSKVDNELQIEVNGNLALAIDNQGQVGIGTSPNERLEINGSVRGAADQNGALRISTATGWTDIGSKDEESSHFVTNRPKFYFNKEIRVNSGRIGSYNEDLRLRTSGISRITVDNTNGNVGIGRAPSTNSKLDVAGRILRNGAQFSQTGIASHNTIVGAPWGTTADWNIFVAPRDFTDDDQSDEEDEALLGIECRADQETNTSWRVQARFRYREEAEEGTWRTGSANYILIPR